MEFSKLVSTLAFYAGLPVERRKEGHPLPIQTGALPWRITSDKRAEVLLVTGRRSGRWIIPKGWPIPGKSLAKAAEREAYEEAGVEGTVEEEPLGSFNHVKTHPLIGSVEVSILVHSMAVKRELPRWPERGERERRWFKLKEAAESVESPELRDMILELRRRFGSKS